ncbi:hypothetical protein SAY87_019141 [Trapa incisa]|uniref:Uncharacterized protein n=1 Tax=Trapa incisa TaxID=236973 RepID=A0AAN7K6Q7_9MYRT|nr:hypothetical protein SAY87_019141 [Trapa incisa]
MAAAETKISAVKMKPPSNQDGSSKANLVMKKKIESSTKQTMSSVIKSEVKSKATPSSSKSTTKTATTRVREKKVFTLPGQKHDPPEEREPLRIFYESLSYQIPTSEMAEFWMMEHGLLSPERAKKAYEKKQRKQKQIRMGTPIKPSSSYFKPESSSQRAQQQPSKNGDMMAKKRTALEHDDEDDLPLSFKKRKM